MPVMGAHTEQLAQLGRSLQHQIDAMLPYGGGI